MSATCHLPACAWACRCNVGCNCGKGSTRRTWANGNTADAACAKSPWFAPTSMTQSALESCKEEIQRTNWLNAARFDGAKGASFLGIMGKPRILGAPRTRALFAYNDSLDQMSIRRKIEELVCGASAKNRSRRNRVAAKI